MMRTLALDVGDKRIGVAVSDALGITAQGLETYHRSGSTKRDVEHILELLRKYAPCRLLLGMPKNMNGTIGEQGEKVMRFAESIQKVWDGELVYYDERLTTMAARRVLLDADVSRGKQKKVIDKLAAVLILQSYMDSQPSSR